MPLSDAELRTRASAIRLALFDVDGVLTDGRLYLGPNGEETRTSHVRDGHGLKLLGGAGIATGVISGRPGGSMRRRLADLGLEHVHFEVRDKIAVFEQILEKTDLDAEQVSFMGDDTPDCPLLQRCGLAMAVADAHPQVMKVAHWVSDHKGGAGAARQACDLILAAHDRS